MLEQLQGFQLSPQQKRLWLTQQDSSVYRSQCAILIEGSLRVNILREALQQVINRYEILRTNFYHSKGLRVPIQTICDRSTLFLQESTARTENLIERLFINARQHSFNLEKDFLLQTILVSLSHEKFLLFLDIPALIADTTTLNNLVSEIGRCYAACLQGEEISDEPLQYADLAQWQNELLESKEAKEAQKYWNKFDFSQLNTSKLTSEIRNHDRTNFNSDCITLLFDADSIGKIDAIGFAAAPWAIARQYRTSISTVLLTCWQILLWRLTGQSDLIIGINFDGRNYEELKEAIGLFAKYLPICSNLEATQKFSNVLANVNQVLDEISQQQESFSWEKINESEDEFFPFCFEYEETPSQYIAADISLSIVQHYVCFDRFKIKLSCLRKSDNAIALEFHYDTNLFATEDIQRLAEQFETLLNSVIENPEATIDRLNLLSQKERSQLLIEFNNTKTATLPYRCIHHWFEEQCNRTPDNIAVVCENQQLTYRELNNRANQLAHYLQKLGVREEVLVGICIERSLEMVIGILGILKAGGAYVAIDPIYPQERKVFILEDTQMPLLLTQQRLAADIPTNTAKVICLDSDWEIRDRQSTENPVSETNELNLAYVIYTSGSTGKPKGTLISHRGLVNYLNWCTQAYEVAQGTGTLVHSSLAFDLTITSLLSPLLVGNQVELLPEKQGIDALWTKLRHKSNLSLIKITPAHLELLSQQLSPQEASDRTNAFIIGGENLTTQQIAFWQDFAPNTMLVNEYGPTETVVGCCIYRVPTNYRQSGSIPIGSAIANTQLYVLDRYLQPVPIGVPGELYIGGAGLARGYLNRPELTAEKFIPNPFSNEPGERLYKTGDLVMFRSDGNLEFLGRIDNQVKIRGFRIELGEIETLLSQHPNVKDAVVIVREDTPSERRLVAYIVLKQESPENLRDYLKQKLPDYMVPSDFVPLKAFPLTINGKIDKKALPEPKSASYEDYIAPRNSTEEEIAKIWAEILKRARVGIRDNFFDMGGHSLLVTQLISRLRDTFQIELPVQQIFETPTIADLALVITQQLAQEADEDLLAQALAELESSIAPLPPNFGGEKKK
jgi:amino acid adenylation domain-containing protein